MKASFLKLLAILCAPHTPKNGERKQVISNYISKAAREVRGSKASRFISDNMHRFEQLRAELDNTECCEKLCSVKEVEPKNQFSCFMFKVILLRIM